MTGRSLAQAQSDLVAALVGTGPDPVGFDPHRLAVARHALLHKRAGGIAGRWPAVVADLGPRWHAEFAAWAASRPTAGSLLDGWAFAEELEAAGRLGPSGRTELASYRADLERTDQGVRRRTGLRRGRSGPITVWRWGSRIVVRGDR